MDESWVKQLREEFAKPLPGMNAQLRMSSLMKRPLADDKPLKNSGVLLLLYPHEGGICTVFIRRTEYQGVHSGQISLPGGIYKESDESLKNTAIREAKEEIGIDPAGVSVIGQLTLLHISVSNTRVLPFVAISDKRPEFVTDPREVQYLIETSMDALMNPLNQRKGFIQVAGMSLEAPYYDIRGQHIWGATAMIISEFLEITRKIM